MTDFETTFLFWNVHQNAVDEQLIRLINYEKIDVVALAESAYVGHEAELMTLINSNLPAGSETFHPAPMPARTRDQKIQTFSRLRRPDWNIEFEHDRYTGWSFSTNRGTQLLLVGAHFPSIQYDQGDGQRKTAIELRQDIETFEGRWQEEHPVGFEIPMAFVVGDLNANPFDAGIAGFYGLNASGNRDIVRRQGARVLNGRAMRFFYNPMWRFLGNGSSPGTYYDRLSSPVCYDWFVLDQVLLSPAIMPHFDEDTLRILTWDAGRQFGGQRLTKPEDNTPIGEISDHLPLVFKFRFDGASLLGGRRP